VQANAYVIYILCDITLVCNKHPNHISTSVKYRGGILALYRTGSLSHQGDVSSFFFREWRTWGRKLVSAAVRTVMRGAITLTGERIHSSNYVAPTNFCPSVNLRNSRRRICARGGLRGEERARGVRVGGYGWPFCRFSRFPALTSGPRHPRTVCRTHRRDTHERYTFAKAVDFYIYKVAWKTLYTSTRSYFLTRLDLEEGTWKT